MLRRFLIAGGLLTLLASAVPMTAAVAAGASPGVHYKSVCGVSRSATYAECFALVRTDAKGHVLSSPTVSGYGPVQFHTGYNLPTTVTGKHTIAIVDAYSNPNVLANLNTYNTQFGLPTMKAC